MSPAITDTPGHKAELELRRHFDGKRNGTRIERSEPVALRGRRGGFSARSMDVSRSGILLEIEDDGFGGSVALAAAADLARVHFGTGADITLLDRGERLRGRLVRVTARLTSSGFRVLVAFAFKRLRPAARMMLASSATLEA